MTNDQQNLPKPTNGVSRIKALLEQEDWKKRFEQILGRRAPIFMASITSAVTADKSGNLGLCDPASVVAGALLAAALDLPITPGLGLAFLVPYRTKDGWFAQFQIGWKGYMQLALRSGQYRTINLAKVYEGQVKSRNPFTGDIEFDLEAKPSTNVIGYLVFFRLHNGYEKYLYWTKEEVLTHGKRYSKSFNFGPWKDHFDAMALKTVVRNDLPKYGPLTVEMQQAIASDYGTKREMDGEVEYLDNADGDALPTGEEKKPKRGKRVEQLVAGQTPATVVTPAVGSDDDIRAAAEEASNAPPPHVTEGPPPEALNGPAGP